jgi:hypothetical protein
MTLNVGVDLDCLLEKGKFSKNVVHHDTRDIRVYFTTENFTNVTERVTTLLHNYPEFKTLENIFTKKENCDYHIDNIDLPEEWFKHKTNINKVYEKLFKKKLSTMAY